MRLRVLLEPRFGATYEQILGVARATEEAGLDAFFRGDHFLGIQPTEPTFVPTDSWTTLAGLARDTSRIRLGTLMTASTFRLPGQLAVAVATVDTMSGGRIELGIGTGWYEREHRFFGIPFPPLGQRFDRLEEQLAVITGLWTTPPGQPFDFAGRYYTIEGCLNPPLPAQRPRPPIIIGGGGPRRTPTLAARFADEFNSGIAGGLEERFAAVRRICEEVGRDPATLRLSAALPTCCATSREEAERRADALGEAGRRLLSSGVVGVASDVVSRVEELAKAGADTVYFHIYETDPDQIGIIGAEVLSAVREG